LNLILFDPAEIGGPLARSDPRAAHLLNVLGRGVGDTFDAGAVNGSRGRGTLVAIGPDSLDLAFAWGAEPPAADPIALLIGLPRPQTARDILRDATTMGVAALHFVATEKSDAGYAQSTLWTSGEWRRHLLTGAAQAFDTRIPIVTWGRPLAEALAEIGAATTACFALDNYEAGERWGSARTMDAVAGGKPVALAIGPERGWGPADRELLRAHGFELVHLGERALRTEMAVIAALAVLKAG
jgi:RsmE family RNA methyltransferase